MKPKFTGICICGHSFDDHHHSIVINVEALKENNVLYKMINGIIAQECEATQFEGMPIDNVSPCKGIPHKEYPHCRDYQDKGWPL